MKLNNYLIKLYKEDDFEEPQEGEINFAPKAANRFWSGWIYLPWAKLNKPNAIYTFVTDGQGHEYEGEFDTMAKQFFKTNKGLEDFEQAGEAAENWELVEISSYLSEDRVLSLSIREAASNSYRNTKEQMPDAIQQAILTKFLKKFFTNSISEIKNAIIDGGYQTKINLAPYLLPDVLVKKEIKSEIKEKPLNKNTELKYL